MAANVPTTKSVTVSSTATKLVDPDLTRGIIYIGNTSGAAIYVGGSDVTTSNGLPVAAGATLTVSPAYSTLYAIVTSSTADVRVMEIH